MTAELIGKLNVNSLPHVIYVTIGRKDVVLPKI